jgi:DnaK suppressor protein
MKMRSLPGSVLKVLKDRLIRLRDTALDEARTAETRGLQPPETEDGDTQDRAERAEALREEEIDKAGIRIDRATVRAADAALQRIADGSYGVCQDCGRPISQARLFALPTALRCAACQQVHEQRHGRR